MIDGDVDFDTWVGDAKKLHIVIEELLPPQSLCFFLDFDWTDGFFALKKSCGFSQFGYGKAGSKQ